MFALLIFVSLAACLLMGILWTRARREAGDLRKALESATEEQRTKDSLLSQRSELDTIKDEFISTVSHELRTPLTSIRGALGLLSAGQMGIVDAKAQNLLRIAVTNTDRLIRLINDILDLERMQSGRSPLHIRRCSLRELVNQALETMKPMADESQVDLKVVLAADPESIFFDGDPDRILQVLTNLLSNAIKFSPPLGIVEFRIEADAQAVLLRVSDQGRGIPSEKLETVFDRFQQVEASDARQKGGTGLGLAICRSIVEQHGGLIWAESNIIHHRGPGASLLVSLPRNSRALDDPHAKSLAAASPLTSDGILILCDDDESIRTVVGEHLRRRGYTILEADRGERAIELAGKYKVAAILLDLYMPGISGWETLERLKSAPATAGIPVVILSVLSREVASRRREPASDAQGWVQKPFNEHLLLTELSRVLHTGDGPARVLLVEDDHDLASVVIAGFEDANITVDHADSRQSAIQHCQLASPDLLILDLDLDLEPALPHGDGYSLVDWMRQQPTLRALPVIVYSSVELSESEMSQLRLGPTQFLAKAKVQPAAVDELVLNIVHQLREPGAPRIVFEGQPLG